MFKSINALRSLVFVGLLAGLANGAGGLPEPTGLTFGPDGHLYVSTLGRNGVLRYDGTTGEFMDVFATTPPAGRFSESLSPAAPAD